MDHPPRGHTLERFTQGVKQRATVVLISALPRRRVRCYRARHERFPPFPAARELPGLPRPSRNGRDLHPRPPRRHHRRVHELLARLLRGRTGARGHPRERRHVRLRQGGQARRQLHPDDGGLGRGTLRHGRADPGHGLAGPARAPGLADGALLHVHRHVRRGRRHALHADPRRPHAAVVPLGIRGRQHPARADRHPAPARVDQQARRRRSGGPGQRARGEHDAPGHRGRGAAALRQHRLLGLDAGRRHDRGRPHRRAGDRRRGDRRRADALAAHARHARRERRHDAVPRRP